jgi:hypothetical protein
MVRRTLRKSQSWFSRSEAIWFLAAVVFVGAMLYYTRTSASPLPRSESGALIATGFPTTVTAQAYLSLAQIDLSEARRFMAGSGRDWFDDLPTTSLHRTWMKDSITRALEGYDVMQMNESKQTAFIEVMRWGSGLAETQQQNQSLWQRVWEWLRSIGQAIYRQTLMPPVSEETLEQIVTDDERNPLIDVNWWYSRSITPVESTRTTGYNAFTTASVMRDQAAWMNEYNISQIRTYKRFYLDAIEFFRRVSDWHATVNQLINGAAGVRANMDLDEIKRAGGTTGWSDEDWLRALEARKQVRLKYFSASDVDYFNRDDKQLITEIAMQFTAELRTLQNQFVQLRQVLVPTRWEVLAVSLARQASLEEAFQNGYFDIRGMDISGYAISPYWNVTRRPLVELVFLSTRNTFETELRALDLAIPDTHRPGGWRYFDDNLVLEYVMARGYPISPAVPSRTLVEQNRLRQFGLQEQHLRALDAHTGFNMLFGLPVSEGWGGLSELFGA